MTEHSIVGSGRASQFDTDPTLKEVKCGSKYYVLGADGDYCPNCGEKLN